jgi:hydroxymethylbilane synthase
VQLQELRADLRIVGLRGNMDTRLAKTADHHAVVAAAAALVRLGLTDRIAQTFTTTELIPQVGQGCLAVECRTDDAATLELLAPLEHSDSRRALEAERAFLAELGGDCDLPAGAHAVVDGTDPQVVHLAALLAEDGVVRRTQRSGRDGPSLGRSAALELRSPA